MAENANLACNRVTVVTKLWLWTASCFAVRQVLNCYSTAPVCQCLLRDIGQKIPSLYFEIFDVVDVLKEWHCLDLLVHSHTDQEVNNLWACHWVWNKDARILFPWDTLKFASHMIVIYSANQWQIWMENPLVWYYCASGLDCTVWHGCIVQRRSISVLGRF